jgi:hypothetical protein
MTPTICEGEILKVEKRAKFGERNIIRYTVLAYINGKQIVLSHVESTNMFGGIADYTVVRQRAMFDTEDTSDFPIEQNEIDATIGARVILAIVGPASAYIIGFKQHPNQVPEIIDADTKKPQAVFQFLGIRAEIKDNGDIQFIHKGAPEISYKPSSSSLIDNNLVGKQLELAAKTGGDATGGNGNDAITPADKMEIVLWEMVKGGGFKIRDAEGQSFLIDRQKKKVTLTNNSLPSWLSPDAPSASSYTGYENEYIEMDKGKGSITIRSTKLTDIKSDGDRKDTTKGSYKAEITKTYSVHIKDNEDRKVDGGFQIAVEKNMSTKVGGSYSVVSKKDISLEGSGGTKLVLKDGKIAFKGGSAELLDLISQAFMILSTTTAAGFGAPLSSVGQFAQLQAQIDAIKGSV